MKIHPYLQLLMLPLHPVVGHQMHEVYYLYDNLQQPKLHFYQ
jgi:hypothetical protein